MKAFHPGKMTIIHYLRGIKEFSNDPKRTCLRQSVTSLHPINLSGTEFLSRVMLHLKVILSLQPEQAKTISMKR